MKIYLIVALLLGALVVAHSLEEDENVELPEALEDPEQPDQPEEPEEDAADPLGGTEGDAEDGGTEGDMEDAADPLGGTEGDAEDGGTEGDMEEADDEVKRRLRNVLSSLSCLRLKRRRACRRPFIRNLCRRTCRPPVIVCRDRLSPVSCRRLKFPFRKCRTSFGRNFCRRTCTGCGRDPCRNYAVLNQLNRRQSRNRGNARPLCDKRGFATRWYRFTGLAGYRIPRRPPPKNRCGTHAPGWMVGSYPARRGQVVRRKVCYHWGNNRCAWSNFIRVKRCGGYLVFFLRPTPACNLRYCGNA